MRKHLLLPTFIAASGLAIGAAAIMASSGYPEAMIWTAIGAGVTAAIGAAIEFATANWDESLVELRVSKLERELTAAHAENGWLNYQLDEANGRIKDFTDWLNLRQNLMKTVNGSEAGGSVIDFQAWRKGQQ